MRLDTHIHSIYPPIAQNALITSLQTVGFDGGILFSHPPKAVSLPGVPEAPDNKTRLEAILQYVKGQPHLFPFYFLDPTEEDAAQQVATAVEKGIMGFKIICAKHAPCDERALPVYRQIAALHKPILFHSGILYDGKNASGNFNRPCNFEGLLEIRDLRFALAHASWPWTDECLAVYGKFDNYRKYAPAGESAEMFIDISPGTPPIYRKALLEKLLFVGYDLAGHILYGIDTGITGEYDVRFARETLVRDEAILQELLVDEAWKDGIYRRNILRFLGLTAE